MTATFEYLNARRMVRNGQIGRGNLRAYRKAAFRQVRSQVALALALAPTPVVDGASTEEELAEWLAEEDVRIAAERAERKAKDRADFKAMRALGGGMGSLIRKKAPAAVVAPVVDEFDDFDDLPF